MTRTFNFKIIWFTLGALLVLEAGFMLLSSLVAFLYKEADALPILYAALITLGFAGLGILFGRKAEKKLGKREGYIIVALVWIVFSLFGMLPFYLSGAIPSITDAYFETMSGFTTTGSSILTDVEVLSHGLHFWRSLTHWLGGMGIIVLSLAILPFFGIGGMSLYTAEATGATYEKLRPKIKDTAKLLWGIYVLLTALETVCLSLLGMDVFEAVCQRAANGHNDLMDTAKKLLDVKNKLFTKEQIKLKQIHTICKRPPSPTKPIPTFSFGGSL